MTILGFNFTKIEAEKKAGVKGKININNNVTIKDIGEIDFSIGKQKQNALKFVFQFVSSYEPGLGKIQFEGEILYLGDDKKNKEILANWKEDKKVPKDIMANMLNTILVKCNVQALIISQDLNLPPPIPLPKVEAKPASKDYIG